MNDRVRKLSEQARKYASDYVADCKHYGYYMEHNEYELRFEEKFAELIVKETIMQMAIQMDKFGDNQANNPIWYKSEEALKQHFGIEE